MLLAALIAVGAWFFTGMQAEDWDDVAYGADGTTIEAPPEEEVADPVDVPTPPDEAEPARHTVDAGSDLTDFTPRRPATRTESELGFPVRVVEKASRAPVPGALVYYFDTLSPRYRQFRSARRMYRADKESALNRYGELAVADAAGVAILPHGIPTQAIAVRHENLYAELQVSGKRPPPRGGYVVELEIDRTLMVQVVDIEDQPVTGVHLAFYVGFREPGGKLRWGLWRDPDRDVRSSDGIQKLPHVQRFVELLRNLGKADPIVHIGLDLPGMTRCGPAISIDDIPEDPVKIVMAEYGRVTVQVTDADGEPVGRRVRLSTAPDFAYPDLASNPTRLTGLRPKWDLDTDEEGRVVFDKVALGTKVRIESLGADVGETERADVNGPARADQEVVVQLTRPFTAALLEGVAQDAEGRELPNVRLGYVAHRENGGSDTEYLARGGVTTDEEGRFRIRLAPTTKVKNTKNELVDANLYSRLGLAIAGGQSTLRARVSIPIPQRLRAQRYQVGPVRLKLPTLIAKGRVYLDDKPIGFFDRFVLDFRNPDNKNRWERIEDIGVHGKPGGYFEVRGDLRDRPVRLRARSWGYLPVAPVMISHGQHDIDIRLYSAGALRVVVLHDIEAADAAMEVLLKPIQIDYPKIDNALKWQFVGRVDKRSSGNQLFRRVYWWTGLPPGSYSVELRLLGESRPFVTLDQLKPTFGMRLEEMAPEIINLRGVIRRVKVRARDGKGRRIAGMVFPLNQTTIGTREGVKMGPKGAVLHTASRGGADLQVVAKGYRAETAYGVDGERVVTMRPGIPITVKIASPRLPKGVRLVAMIRRRSYDFKRLYRQTLRNPVNSRSGSRPLTILMGERDVDLRYRGRRQWKTTLMEHGRFSLLLRLTKKGAEPVRLKGYSPSRLMVRDTSTEHKFSVVVSKRWFDRALQQLGVEPEPSRKKAQRKKDPEASKNRR